jgi:hypothetical protein
VKKYAAKFNRTPGALAQKFYTLRDDNEAEEYPDEYIKKLINNSVYPEGGMEAINSITPEDIQTYREGLMVKKLNSSLIKNGGNLSKDEISKTKKKIYMHNYNAVKQKEKQEILDNVNPSDLFQLTESIKRISARKVEIQYHLDALNQLLNNL